MPKGNCNIRSLMGALALGTMLAAVPADAATLKQNPTVTGSMIRVGDLFDDTGESEDAVVMEAPAPGASDNVTAYELERIAKEHDIDWERPSYLKRVTVQREGVAFALADLKPMVLDAAQQQGLQVDVQVKLYGSKRGLFLPVDAGIFDIELEQFILSDKMDRFTATALIPTGNGTPKRLRLTGNLDEVRLVPTLNRVVAPGEIITKADISWENYPAKRLNRATVLDQTSMIGQTVRRALKPGTPLRENDLRVPVVIEKGSIVKMTITAGALTLTANGRALENGGTGDTIRVMNTKSKQSVEAEILRPGLVKVTSNSLALAAL